MNNQRTILALQQEDRIREAHLDIVGAYLYESEDQGEEEECCPACLGDGYTLNWNVCRNCNGSGRVPI